MDPSFTFLSPSKDNNNRRQDNWKKKVAVVNKKKRIDSLVTLRNEERQRAVQQRRLSIEPESANGYNNNDMVDRTCTRELIALVMSNDPSRHLDAITRLRKLLSIEHNPPIKEVIDAGVVPRLIEFLAKDNQHLQYESCWALTNIMCSCEQIGLILDSGALPHFKLLLCSPNVEVIEQAVWAIGNIAADSVRHRDLVLNQGILEPILKLAVNLSQPTKVLRRITWTLANLCRGKPQPQWHLVSKAIPTLTTLVRHQDDEILTDACWALTYLSDGPNERIQTILDTGVAPRIVELLLHDTYNVQTPALRMIGNVVTGDDTQTQVIINAGVLPNLLTLLSSSKKTLKKEACWVLSNITAGTRQQVEAVINAQILPRLVYLLKNSEFDIKKEAAWALSNATTCGSPEQIRYMVDCGMIEPMCDLLSFPDPKIILVGLEALENILKVGEGESYNSYATQIEECSGLDKLESLQNHTNKDIYERAIAILENYFAAEEEEQDFPNYSTTDFLF